MAITTRSAQSVGGPRGGTAWFDSGEGFLLATIAGSTTPTTVITTTQPGLIPMQVISRPNPFFLTTLGSVATNQDVLDPTTILNTLYGFQVAASVVQAATIHLTLNLSVFRTVGLLSGAGTSAMTSIPLKAALTQAIPTAATLTITRVDGSATGTTLTLSAAAPAGATTLAVNSVNLSNAQFADGAYITYQVGGGPAFGWIAGAGAGTPTFPVGATVMAPAIAANTSLVTPASATWLGPGGTATTAGIPLQAGDVLVLNVLTDSSTVTASPIMIETLVS
jgi:hypothetical protein